MIRIVVIAVFMCSGVPLRAEQQPKPTYLWLPGYDAQQSIAVRIAPPREYQRVQPPAGSFGDWLQRMPLKSGNPQVLLFDGKPKANQNAHAAVINLDVGRRDLQQCADSIIRLRAEYLASVRRTDEIQFTFTSGHRAAFSKWAGGYRPSVTGSDVQWRKTARADPSYRSLRAFLDVVFTYAGTISLNRELKTVNDSDPIEVGDVFIRAGSPGHAVIVVDVAAGESGKRVFLLAQGYMPAQEMHVLKNPSDGTLGPWYDGTFRGDLKTPEWTFKRGDRKRF